MSSVVAVRSLQCKDHAYNIPPKVLTINWNLTKRCNYDCSYCNSFTHDAVSPFVDMDNIAVLLNTCEQWCKPDRKIKWCITGGEPFLDPNFITVLDMLAGQSFTEQINTISNGSLPLEKYLQASKFVAGITFSLHFERSESELNKILKTIIQVKQQTAILVSVNVMFLPGLADQIQATISKLKQHEISYVVRLITPLDDEANKIKPYINETSNRKTIILKSADKQSAHRQQFKHANDKQALQNIQNYYTDEELLLVKNLNTTASWHNAGIWTDDNSYTEVNTDQLVSSGRHSFKNWICYAGVDSVYLDWDGTIFRGMCFNDGPIGHIKNNTFINTSATKCHLNLCQCNIDIAVRKSADVTYLKLIT